MAGKKFLAGAIFLMVTGALAISPLQFAEQEITAGADDEYASLANEINQILQDERLDGALAGVSIREAETGEKIYDHFGDTRLVPASNTKLFTAAAAFETLGEDYRFTTEIHTDGAAYYLVRKRHYPPVACDNAVPVSRRHSSLPRPRWL